MSNKQEFFSKDINTKRRKLLQASWITPIVVSVSLPSHAQTSNLPNASCPSLSNAVSFVGQSSVNIPLSLGLIDETSFDSAIYGGQTSNIGPDIGTDIVRFREIAFSVNPCIPSTDMANISISATFTLNASNVAPNPNVNGIIAFLGGAQVAAEQSLGITVGSADTLMVGGTVAVSQLSQLQVNILVNTAQGRIWTISNVVITVT